MSKCKKYWIYWAIMYVICTVCAFLPVENGLVYALFFFLSVGFFVPPGFLIYEAVQRREKKTLRRIRTLSIISLVLTMIVIVLTFVSVAASKQTDDLQYMQNWGVALQWILNIVSTPMVCSQIWVVSLFGWACLMMTCFMFLKKK